MSAIKDAFDPCKFCDRLQSANSNFLLSTESVVATAILLTIFSTFLISVSSRALVHDGQQKTEPSESKAMNVFHWIVNSIGIAVLCIAIICTVVYILTKHDNFFLFTRVGLGVLVPLLLVLMSIESALLLAVCESCCIANADDKCSKTETNYSTAMLVISLLLLVFAYVWVPAIMNAPIFGR